MAHIPGKEDIQKAAERIAKYAHRTPILRSSSIDEMTGAKLFFKCENFQKVGAFKFRGAINTAMQLEEGDLMKGLATHSSGNHGQAVALAAKMNNVPAYIVMPKNSTKAKIEAVKGYGAKVILCENSLAAREEELNKVVEEKGAYFIHPYDDFRVIAGQGSSAYELIEDVDDLDIIVTPIGGGGLISGSALSAAYFGEKIEVIGVEPEGADSASKSIEAGQWTDVPHPNTVCDGLRAGIGKKNFEVISQFVNHTFRVSDKEAVQAMRIIWERMKIIVEPSCAVPLAGILKKPELFRNKKVGIILTGGNIDPEYVSEMFKQYK